MADVNERLRQLEMLELQKMREKAANSGLGPQLMSVPEGFNRGLAKGFGGLVDLATSGINMMLPEQYEIQDPVGGTQSLLRGMESMGIGTTPANRLIGRVSEEVGAAALPFGVAGGMARTASQGGRFFGPVLESFRQAPKATAATELGAASGAGLGAGIAQEIAPGSAGAELTGQVVGGIVNPLSVTRAVGGQAKRLGGAVDRILPGGAERAAAKKLQGLIDDPQGMAQKLRQGDVDTLTPAQETEDLSLLRLQEAFRKSDPDVAQALSNMEQATRKGIAQQADDMARMSGAPRDFIQGRVDDITNQMDDMIKRADARAQNEIASISTRDGVTRETTNRLARAQLDDAYSEAKKLVDGEWAKVDSDEIVPTAGLKESYRNIVSQLSKAEKDDVPEVAKRLINTEFGEQEAVKELQGLRSKLLQEARNARSGDTPNLHKASIADRLADSILDTMDSELSSDQLQVAIKATAQLKDKFSKGVIGDIRKLKKTGGQAAADAQTLETLVRPGPLGGANFDDYMRATNNSPEAKQTVVDYLANRFVTEATNDAGRVVPQAARTFVKNNNEILNRLPQLKAKIQKARRLDDLATVTEKNLLGRKRSLMDKRKSRAALYLGGKVDQEVAKVLNSQNPVANMKELVKITNKDLTGAAKEGLKAQFINQMMDTPNPMAFHEAQRKVSSALFNKDEMARIDKLMDTYRRIDPRTAQGIKFDEEPDMLVDLLSRLVGANLGAQSAAGGQHALLMAGHGSRMVRKLTDKIPGQRTKDILAAAVLDKKKMADLLEKVDSPRKLEKLQGSLNAWTINLLSQDDEGAEE